MSGESSSCLYNPRKLILIYNMYMKQSLGDQEFNSFQRSAPFIPFGANGHAPGTHPGTSVGHEPVTWFVHVATSQPRNGYHVGGKTAPPRHLFKNDQGERPPSQPRNGSTRTRPSFHGARFQYCPSCREAEEQRGWIPP